MEKQDKIKKKAEEMGSSYYKFVDPYIVSLSQKLGEGSFGVVWSGANFQNDQLVAVKQISCQKLQKDPEKLLLALKNQIDIMKKLKHENVVALYDVRKSSNNIYLFLELCTESLEQRLKKKVRFSEKEVIEISRQIINGYKFLMSKGIIHRDMKPANILIKDQFYKIADFGFAKMSEEETEEEKIHQTSVGSPLYMCPQILNGKQYSNKCDLWSVGVIMYELLFGKPPFLARSFNELVAVINKKPAIKFPIALNNKGLEQILRKMLEYDQKDRLSWKEVFQAQVFNPKKQDLVATLKQSIQIAQQFPKNSIIGSHKANQMYFNQNKVVQKVELDQQQKQKANEVTQQQAQNKIQPQKQQDAYKSLVQRHDVKQKIKQVIKKITGYFLFKRNKAVFINHISIKLYECFDQGSLKLSLQNAQRILFVLSKYQCAIIFRSFIRLKQGKLGDCTLFTQEEFKLFLQSPFKNKIIQNLKNDFNIMKMFLEDLIKKVKENLQKNSQNDPSLKERKQKIQKICNSSLAPKQLMRQIFAEHIQELRQIVIESMKNSNSQKLLELGYFVTQTLKPFAFDYQKVNYNLYYEEVLKMTEEELRKEILREGKDTEEGKQKEKEKQKDEKQQFR